MMKKIVTILVLILTLSMPQIITGQTNRGVSKPKVASPDPTTKTKKTKPKASTPKPSHTHRQGNDNRQGNAQGNVNRQSAMSSSQKAIVDRLVANMVYVEGGTFMMGATSEQRGYIGDDTKPAHRVTVSSFYIGKYEVTRVEVCAVMGYNPSDCEGPDRPYAYVSWNECQIFINKLNQLTGKHFRLLTEAEWEYAARGGRKSQGYMCAGSNNANDVAWYDGNSGYKTHPVGTKAPNELGLYDMSGNLWEWCQDWYGENYYSSSPSSNPKGPSSGSRRVIRGGCGSSVGWACSVSIREGGAPDSKSGEIGLRLAL